MLLARRQVSWSGARHRSILLTRKIIEVLIVRRVGGRLTIARGFSKMGRVRAILLASVWRAVDAAHAAVLAIDPKHSNMGPSGDPSGDPAFRTVTNPVFIFCCA
jgi:hypothetical protein